MSSATVHIRDFPTLSGNDAKFKLSRQALWQGMKRAHEGCIEIGAAEPVIAVDNMIPRIRYMVD